MKDIPNSLSRNILRFRGLTLRINVRLKDNEGKIFYSKFSFMNKTYVKLDPTVYLILELDRIDSEYDPSRSIALGQGNIHMFVREMKKMLKEIYTEDIFALKNNEVVIYNDMQKTFTKTISIPRMGVGIVIMPSVIYDENEISYEGVRIFINNTTNFIDLAIDEFEALVYTIEHTDLFTYSQLLINYICNDNIEMIDNQVTVKQPINRNMIDWSKHEKVEANFRKCDNEDIMSSLSDINHNKDR